AGPRPTPTGDTQMPSAIAGPSVAADAPPAGERAPNADEIAALVTKPESRVVAGVDAETRSAGTDSPAANTSPPAQQAQPSQRSDSAQPPLAETAPEAPAAVPAATVTGMPLPRDPSMQDG